MNKAPISAQLPHVAYGLSTGIKISDLGGRFLAVMRNVGRGGNRGLKSCQKTKRT